MCRLLGYAAPTPRTVSSVLGDDQLAVFRDMAQFHRDGWGSSWVDTAGGIGLETEKQDTSGLDDPQLVDALTRFTSKAKIVHLRLATDGMSCVTENTHPFVAEGFAFAHNGSFPNPASIEPLLSPSVWARLRGDTDSERYFGLIRTFHEDGRSLSDATLAAARELQRRYPQSSLNALLLSDRQLIAVHASSHAPSPVQEFDKRGIRLESLPAGHTDDYYLMRMRQHSDGTVVFASSGLDIDDWMPLPHDSVTSVDLSSLTVRTVALSASGTA